MAGTGIKTGFQWIASIAIMIGAVWTVRIWLLESYRISTPAMETALHEGDYILANKCLDLFPPRQNDVVLFTSPLRQDSTLRPLFVSRCIGMPGDTIQVSSEGYRINGRAFPRSPRALNTYFIALSIKEAFLQQAERLNIPVRDLETEPFGITLCLTTFEEYQLREALGTDLSSRFVCRQIRPYQLVIPKKGRAYRLDEYALTACREAILTETAGKAVFRNGKLYLDGKETNFFFFQQDYYWLLSDNTNEAVDSRHLGFVPRDHLVATFFFRWFDNGQ